jgi:hypothetical protein
MPNNQKISSIWNSKNMTAFETKAVFENDRTLRLNEPIFGKHSDVIRVILLMDESIPKNQSWPELFFEKNYGSCQSDPLDIPTELVYESNRMPL